MPFPHQVYKTQRIVPLRFSRAFDGEPDIAFPDIDNRGWFRQDPTGNNPATNDHGFVVGVTQGETISVKLTREKLEDTAPLFVTSSNTATMTTSLMGAPGVSALPTTKEMFVQIDGVSGGAATNPNIARVQVRHGSEAGPIIGEISVWVFALVNINITPHNVTISSATAAGIASAADVAAVMDIVKAIWRPCGVDFTVAPVQPEALIFATAGVADWQAEINTILSTNYVAGSINAYFINQLNQTTLPGTLGLGISRPNSVVFGTPNPGIILADQITGFDRSTDNHYLANDLAHEIGHFFTLAHVDSRDAGNSRNDTWALRMLMHPSNTRFMSPDFRNDTGYGVDSTDGSGYRGSLISMKDLVDAGNAAHHSTDDECRTARRGITTVPPGPY